VLPSLLIVGVVLVPLCALFSGLTLGERRLLCAAMRLSAVMVIEQHSPAIWRQHRGHLGNVVLLICRLALTGPQWA
jgi:hypothetical protein